jgi:hypothetical protein
MPEKINSENANRIEVFQDRNRMAALMFKFVTI